MNSTRATNRSRRRSRTTALVFVAVLVAASCNGDDDDDAEPSGAATTSAPGPTPAADTTAPDTAAPDTTAPETTASAPTVPQTTDTTHDSVPADDCVYRPGELIATSDLADVVAAEIGAEVDVVETPLAPEEVSAEREPVDRLSLYQFGSEAEAEVDPLDLAAALNGTAQEPGPMKAAPNYLASFSQRWKYAPYDDPAEADPPRDLGALAIGETGLPIAVLDTGYVALENAPAQQANVIPLVLQDVPGGVAAAPPPPELLEGRVAGHGTFIVNILAQLLPGATIHAVTLPARLAGDDEYGNSISPGTSVRDDSTITWAIETLLAANEVRLINLSGGSYGCTSLGDGEEYYEPLGLRQLMDVIDERNASGEESDQIQVFAASGNDQQRSGGAVFYPAGWGPDYEWLHSVASDPANDGTDYSNRGDWVEFQAAGSHVVSYLPQTTRPPAGAAAPPESHDEGWYSWSGTSFATPCALAAHAAGTLSLEAATLNGADPFTDCGINAPPED